MSGEIADFIQTLREKEIDSNLLDSLEKALTNRGFDFNKYEENFDNEN